MLFAILFLYGSSVAFASSAHTISDTSFIRKSSITGLPVAYYTPETRLAFGGVGIFAFRFRNQSDEVQPSRLTLAAIYTQERQLLLYVPFDVFVGNQDYRIYGEIGYYRYFYQFYGVGNDINPDSSEIFSVNYPRIKINALKKIRPNLYFGLRYDFDDYNIIDTKTDGLLETNDYVGVEGGILSGLGLSSVYDTRDNLFAPREGLFLEGSIFTNQPFLGSDFSFHQVYLDASTYFTVYKNHVLAVNGYTDLRFGDPPFSHLPQLGGNKKMRGYFQGQYRDKKHWLFQAEYRMPLFWRLGMTVFGGMGQVSDTFENFGTAPMRYSYGAGLRILINKEDRINIRIDVGRNANGDIYPYISLTEAF